MANLSFQERRLLVLYRKFYGANYPAVNGDNQNAHVKAQKMCYLLSLVGVGVGNYGFVWDQFGPYSEEIQTLVHGLDENGTKVQEFYNQYPDGEVSDRVFFTNQSSIESLFRERDVFKIENTRRKFDIQPDSDSPDEYGDTNMRRWTELLGSIAYISQSILPGAGKEQLVEWLVLVKDKYCESEETNRALQILDDMGLLTSINK